MPQCSPGGYAPLLLLFLYQTSLIQRVHLRCMNSMISDDLVLAQLYAVALSYTHLWLTNMQVIICQNHFQQHHQTHSHKKVSKSNTASISASIMKGYLTKATPHSVGCIHSAASHNSGKQLHMNMHVKAQTMQLCDAWTVALKRAFMYDTQQRSGRQHHTTA